MEDKSGLSQQEKYNLYLAHLRGETRTDVVNLENPLVPLNGFTLTEVLSGGRPSTSGVVVNPWNSLKLSAVWRCINILSGVISSLPSKPYRETDKGREEAKDHSTYKLFTRRMGPLYTKTVYWERAIIHLLLRGNHYAEILSDKKGNYTGFNLILPTQIKNIKLLNGKLWYELNGVDEMIPMDRMIHVPHLGEDPIQGKSTIEFAREDLGMEIARREAGAKFWNDGGNAKGLIVPTNKITAPQMAQAKQGFRDAKREGGDIVMPFGLTYVPTTMSPADQEFIMSGNFSIAAICRWFGVPLHKLSELERATMNNIEHQAIEFMQDTIAPICTKIENEYTTKLFTLDEEQDMHLEFNLQAYQRADSQAQAEYYRTAVQNGWLSPNEVATKNGDKPVPGGDRRFIQQNMMPLDQVDKILMQKKAPLQQMSKSSLADNLHALALLAEIEGEGKFNGNGKH